MFSQTNPTLTDTRVWSSTDVSNFEPSAATWASGVITFTQKNHGLATNDTVNVSCADTTSPWNIGNVTATVTDKDTFTVPLASDPGLFPNSQPFPSLYVSKRVTVKCSAYSRTFFLATFLQITDLGGATNLKLQAKLHEDAPWTDIADHNAMVLGITKMVSQYNYMRVTVATGTATTVPVVYSQK